MVENILIVGGCVAAKEAALSARKANSTCNITILSEENYYPYYRPMLSECIAENVNEKRFYLASKEDYKNNNIEIKLGEKVTEFLPEQKIVKTEKGTVYPYDKVLIACGSKNFVPLPHAMKIPGVFSIRKYDDAKRARKWALSSKSVIIVGGGLLGLEAAWELKSSGLDVTVIELAPHILPAQLDEEGADFLSKIIASKDVNLILGKSVTEVLGKGKVNSVRLNDGSTLPCDMLLFSVGVRPNIDLVKDSGIKINRGILVNNKMETSIKDVYAAGDVAEIKGCMSGIWLPALEQGRTAGMNMGGTEAIYRNASVPTFLNSFDTRIYSIGNISNTIKSVSSKGSIDSSKGIYKKLYFKEGTLVGGILIGDIKDSTKLSKAIQNKTSIDDALFLLN